MKRFLSVWVIVGVIFGGAIYGGEAQAMSDTTDPYVIAQDLADVRHELGVAQAQHRGVEVERVEHLPRGARLGRVDGRRHEVVLEKDEQAVAQLSDRDVGVALQLLERALRVADQRSANDLGRVAKVLPHDLQRRRL